MEKNLVASLLEAREVAKTLQAARLAEEEAQRKLHAERVSLYIANAITRVELAMSALEGAALVGAQTPFVIPSEYETPVTPDCKAYERSIPVGDSYAVQTRYHVPNHFELQEVCNAVRYAFWKKGLNVIVEHIDELSPYYGHAQITIKW